MINERNEPLRLRQFNAHVKRKIVRSKPRILVPWVSTDTSKNSFPGEPALGGQALAKFQSLK